MTRSLTFTDEELAEIDAGMCVAAGVYRDTAASETSRDAKQFELRRETAARRLMDKIGRFRADNNKARGAA